jgi:hypothetical protein
MFVPKGEPRKRKAWAPPIGRQQPRIEAEPEGRCISAHVLRAIPVHYWMAGTCITKKSRTMASKKRIHRQRMQTSSLSTSFLLSV